MRLYIFFAELIVIYSANSVKYNTIKYHVQGKNTLKIIKLGPYFVPDVPDDSFDFV